MSKSENAVKAGENSHVWHFSRVGGVNRVNLESGNDLVNLEHLDQKLWTALSCPVYGLEIDSRTLELIDTDNDGRIRVPEIISAAGWVTSIVKDPDDLMKENPRLPLSAINDSSAEGKTLLSSARQILTNLGKPDAVDITVEETSDTVRIFANTKFNGDGIITEDSADNEGIKKLIGEIISCTEPATDRNGKSGISTDQITKFFNSCNDYSEWYAKAEADLDKILPFGDSTESALKAYLAVKSKIDDYFMRCRLAEFNPDSSEILKSLNAKFEEIRYKDLSACQDEIASFPVSGVDPGKPLHLNKGINPAWAGAIEDFKRLVVLPLFPGKEKLTIEDMDVIGGKFTGYVSWLSEKKGMSVEKLGLIRVREILKSGSSEALNSLIDQDKALEENANNIFLVDKLVRYYRDLYTLLRNYVTFYDFYSPDALAVFQAGKLYFDQRCCELCLKVTDMAKHNTLAGSSGLCLIYCDCVSRSGSDRMLIVAALTDGDFDNIDVGRNGIFYDRKGRDWDATIVKVVDNPISIRQAFWSPYRKISKFISTQVEKFAASKDKEVTSMATSNVEKATQKVDAGITGAVQSPPAPAAPVAPPPPFDIGKFVGIFAALSLAVGAIATAVTSIVKGFFALTWWKMPLAIIGIMLVISGPSMLLAWLKLRKRNLAPLLDANGWAINARATINIIFGRTLTHLAALPENAKLNLSDPFSKKKRPIIPVLIVLLIIISATVYFLWRAGVLTKLGII